MCMCLNCSLPAAEREKEALLQPRFVNFNIKEKNIEDENQEIEMRLHAKLTDYAKGELDYEE